MSKPANKTLIGAFVVGAIKILFFQVIVHSSRCTDNY